MGSVSDVAYVFRVEDVEVLKNKILGTVFLSGIILSVE